MVHRKDKDGKNVVFNWTFTGEDYKKAFGKGRYNTAAPGYSGISMIHLSTIARDPELATIYAKILELPFLRYGFTYKHWLKSVQSLLQKEAMLPYVHRMRILELVSLDYNGILKYIIGRHFATRFEQRKGFQNNESYGAIRKKSAHDALESVLSTTEYSRIM